VENGPGRAHIPRMEKLNRIERVVAFACSATIAALAIAHIALENLNISAETVRVSALLSAGLIGGNIVMEAVEKACKSK
jgi:small neutral amino acid transporter SnatA (MarC family)